MATTTLPLSSSRDRFATMHTTLCVFYLYLALVGLSPFPTTIMDLDARAEGSPVTRVITFGLFFLSLPVLFHYRRAAIDCVRNNKLLYSVVVVACLSIFWSGFPELTLKRSIVLVIYATAATAIAAGTTDLRRFHTILFTMLAIIAVINLATGFVWASRTVSPDGFRGMHLEKNGAGLVAMIGVVVMMTWCIGASTIRATTLGVICLGIQLAFLTLTKSKTAIGIVLIVIPIAAVFYVVKRGGRELALLVVAGTLIIAAVAIGAAMSFNFDGYDMLTSVVSDPTFTGRDLLWRFCYKMANLKPFLGYGYGAFWDVGEANDPLRNEEPGLWIGDVAPGIINEAHNGYLELWLHIGLPATIVAVASVMMAIGSATKRATEIPKSTRLGPTYAAMSMLLLLYLLHNSMEANLFIRGMPFCSLSLILALLARNDGLYRTSLTKSERQWRPQLANRRDP